MDFRIVDYEYFPLQDEQITDLLIRVFVDEGYSDRSVLEKALAGDSLRQRGEILLAKSGKSELVGLIICSPPSSPARQVAKSDEAEMQLLAVELHARGNGIASALVAAFEQRARALAYRKAVLSTQTTMNAAHRLYERSGFSRNPSRDWSKGHGRKYLVYEKEL